MKIVICALVSVLFSSFAYADTGCNRVSSTWSCTVIETTLCSESFCLPPPPGVQAAVATCGLVVSRTSMGDPNAMYNSISASNTRGYGISSVQLVWCGTEVICASDCVPDEDGGNICTNSNWIPTIPIGGLDVTLGAFEFDCPDADPIPVWPID